MKLGLLLPNLKPKFDMLLSIKSNITNNEFEEDIKIKPYQDLTNPALEYYEKIFKILIGSSMKGYCCTCNTFKEVIITPSSPSLQKWS